MCFSPARSASRWCRAADLTVRGNFVYLKTLDGLVKRRRHLSPRRWRLLRFARAARGFGAGRRRPRRRWRAPAMSRSSTCRARPRSRRRPSRPSCRSSRRQLLGERAAASGGDDLVVRPERMRWPRCAPGSTGSRSIRYSTRRRADRAGAALAEDRARALRSASSMRHPERFVARETNEPERGAVPRRRRGAHEPRASRRTGRAARHGGWRDGEWLALPGGVARVVTRSLDLSPRWSHGGIAKDVWVLSDQDTEPPVPRVRRARVRARGARQSRRCAAAPPTICSGSAAMSSASTPARASSWRRCSASPAAA